MNIETIEDFVTICKYENVTKAAKELHISQPALSKSLKLLENYYNTEFFDRNGKNITPNKNGKLFLEFAQELKLKHDAIKSSVAADTREENGLRIIYNDSDIMQLIITSFISAYPNFNIELTSNISRIFSPEKIEDFLLKNEFDVAVLTKPLQNEKIDNLLIYRNNLYVITPKSFPYDNTRFYRLSDMEGQVFLRKKRECEYVDLINEVIKTENIKLNIAYYTEKEIAVELEKVADCCFFTSSIGLHMLKSAIRLENKHVIKLNDPLFTQNIYISYRKKNKSAAAILYLQWMEENYDTLFNASTIRL